MALCNHNYEFTIVDIGDSGESDGSVFAASSIYQNHVNSREAKKRLHMSL